MAKAGRKRKDGAREPTGRLSRIGTQTQATIVPLAALVRRAEACGVDVDAVIKKGDLRKGTLANGSSAVIAALCSNTAGLALERLAWMIRGDGTKERRLIVIDGRPEEMISDKMLAAAEAYRTLWVEWYRTTGLPRRHPQPAQIGERLDRSVDSFADPSPRRMGMIRDWLHLAEDALDACHQRALVWAAIDTVVIDNEMPPGLEFGDRSAGLHALRRGLDALEVLVSTRTKARRSAA